MYIMMDKFSVKKLFQVVSCHEFLVNKQFSYTLRFALAVVYSYILSHSIYSCDSVKIQFIQKERLKKYKMRDDVL